jgi:hypothetical protein
MISLNTYGSIIRSIIYQFGDTPGRSSDTLDPIIALLFENIGFKARLFRQQLLVCPSNLQLL